MASTTLLLPDPFGPTTAVIPGSKRRVVADAKDLKPRSVSDLRCTHLPDQVVAAASSARIVPKNLQLGRVCKSPLAQQSMRVADAP